MSNASILFEKVQTNVMNEANSNGIKRVEKKSNNEIDNSSEQSYSMVPRSKTISVWQKQKKWTEFSSVNKDADEIIMTSTKKNMAPWFRYHDFALSTQLLFTRWNHTFIIYDCLTSELNSHHQIETQTGEKLQEFHIGTNQELVIRFQRLINSWNRKLYIN